MPRTVAPRKQSAWTRVAFGDVVRLCTERSSDPEADGFERYIGLEHLDPGELRVRRWGDLADGVTFTNVFRPGQVLFGKRRAYQRKVAVADFSGVCSGDIYVLEPKNDSLLPELLPFICQTDAFFEHAVGTSAGSLSPRTNWESLASFGFALPPIEEQRRIVKQLHAYEHVLAHLESAETALETVLKCMLCSCFEPKTHSLHLYPRLESLCLRIGDGTHLPPPFTKSGVPFLLVSNISSGILDWNVEKHVTAESYRELTKSFRPCSRDILYSLVGSYGVPVLVNTDRDFTFQRHIGYIRVDPNKLMPEYLYWYLRSPAGKLQADWRAEGLAQKTITLKALRDFRVPVCDLASQRELVERFRMCASRLTGLGDRRKGLYSQRNHLLRSSTSEGSE